MKQQRGTPRLRIGKRPLLKVVSVCAYFSVIFIDILVVVIVIETDVKGRFVVRFCIINPKRVMLINVFIKTIILKFIVIRIGVF